MVVNRGGSSTTPTEPSPKQHSKICNRSVMGGKGWIMTKNFCIFIDIFSLFLYDIVDLVELFNRNCFAKLVVVFRCRF